MQCKINFSWYPSTVEPINVKFDTYNSVNILQQPALLAENEENKSKSDENESEEEESGSDSDNEEEEEEEDGEGDNSKKKSITRPKNETAEDRRVSLQTLVSLVHYLIYQLFICIQVLGSCMSMGYFGVAGKEKRGERGKAGKEEK